MPSVTVENYLKQVCLEMYRGEGEKLVSMGRLAEAVGVTPGTATTMVKSLAEAGLLRYEPRHGVALTATGRKLAHRVVRRHRLVELFLVEFLEMDWAEVHDEAEELEHAISDKVLERIDALLGHPETDPHGSPIPRDGKLREPDSADSLKSCPIGQSLTVSRIVDHDAAFLRFIEANGLMPGARLCVERRHDHTDAVTVLPRGGERLTMGLNAAAKVLVSAS